jgi:hypothetical protein
MVISPKSHAFTAVHVRGGLVIWPGMPNAKDEWLLCLSAVLQCRQVAMAGKMQILTDVLNAEGASPCTARILRLVHLHRTGAQWSRSRARLMFLGSTVVPVALMWFGRRKSDR